MSYDKPICDYFTEWVLEEGWQLRRKFAREIEAEFDIQGKIPIELLLFSANLQQKWLEWVRQN